MKHLIYKVQSVRVIGPYTLEVGFDDRSKQTINFLPVLGGELYRPLRDTNIFNQVKVDPEVHTLVWPNGADFDPATLHDWPKHEKELALRARKWESQLA